MDWKTVYEKYHSNRNLQKRIINKQNFTYRHIISVIDKHLKKSKATRVLDIGSGVGTVDFYIASMGYKVLGVDISDNAINVATKNAKFLGVYKHTKFVRKEFPDKIPNGKYDFIICSEVMEHLPDEAKSINAISKLLKKGGIVFITTPSENSPLEKLGLLRKFNKQVGHLRLYSIEKLTDLVKTINLKVLETRKNEGVLRKVLFIYTPGRHIVRLANRFPLISDLLTLVDGVLLRLFGESHVFIVAKKIK